MRWTLSVQGSSNRTTKSIQYSHSPRNAWLLGDIGYFSYSVSRYASLVRMQLTYIEGLHWSYYR